MSIPRASEVEAETQEDTIWHIKGEIWDRILHDIEKKWEFKEVRTFGGFCERDFRALVEVENQLKEYGWFCIITRKDDTETGDAKYYLLIAKWPVRGRWLEWLTKRVDTAHLAARIFGITICMFIIWVVVWTLLNS